MASKNRAARSAFLFMILLPFLDSLDPGACPGVRRGDCSLRHSGLDPESRDAMFTILISFIYPMVRFQEQACRRGLVDFFVSLLKMEPDQMPQIQGKPDYN